MHITVVDDERPARGELKHQILSVLSDADVMEANSGVSALELFASNIFDILFLDINLDDMEGTTLATAVSRMMPDAKIILATAYSDYTTKAFELGVYDYISKPFDSKRLKTALEECVAEMDKNTSAKTLASQIAVDTSWKTIFLDVEKIACIETPGRSCATHSQKGDYVENMLLGEYEKKLAPYGFSRIHKSYPISPPAALELFPWVSNSLALRMQGFENGILPVARDKMKTLRQALNFAWCFPPVFVTPFIHKLLQLVRPLRHFVQ